MPSSSPAFGALCSRLASLVAKQAWDEVDAACDERLATDSRDAEALFLKAGAAYGRGDLGTARTLASAAFEEAPDTREIAEFLAVINSQGGDLASASYMAKLAGVLPANPAIAAAMPVDLPSFSQAFLNIEERPLFLRGCNHFVAGQWNEAERLFRQHLVFEPAHRDSWLAVATSLGLQGEWSPAIDMLRSARQTLPRDPHLASALAMMLFRQGRLVEAEACHNAAIALAPRDATISALALTHRLADPRSRAEDLAPAFAAWVDRFGGAGQRTRPVAENKMRRVLLCTVTGLVATGQAEPVADLLAKLDPRRYALIGVGPGPLSAPANVLFQAPFDGWIDMSGMDPITLRRSILGRRPDIILDFAGFGCVETTLALSQPLAPVQLAFPTQPFDVGRGYTGRIVDAEPSAGDDTSGSLPRFALPTGTRYASLPHDNAPVAARGNERVCFGIDADIAELHPLIIERWAAVLRAAPECALLVFDRNMSIPTNAARLIELFGDHGLVGAIEVVSETDRQSFMSQIDVLLQPLPPAALETTLAALWSGVPVVVLDGTFASKRTTAAFLRHAGLAECIADDLEAYVALAVAWAKDSPRRQGFREGIRDRLRQAPVFDTGLQAQHLAEMLDHCWAQALEQQPV